MPFYAGIGSRETPQEICDLMRVVGRMMPRQGWILRSGHADGADMAFENGCDSAYGQKEIFLPWYRFNGSNSRLHKIPDWAFEQASEIHPRWKFLKYGERKLHARNILQIMGLEPGNEGIVKVVICWTPNGQAVGGTRTALALAVDLEIPIVNLAVERDREVELKHWCPGI